MNAAIELLNSYIGIFFPALKVYFIVSKFTIIYKIYIYKLLFKVLYVKHGLYISKNMQFEYSTPNNSCK